MIPRFYAGQPVRASDLNALGDEIRKNEITKFNGGTFQRNTGGTSLSVNGGGANGGGGAGGDVTYHPFQLIDGYPVEEGGVVVRINGNSWLTNIETGEKITIIGLGAVPGSPEDNEDDQGQFSLPLPGQYVWLTVTVEKFNILTAEIEIGDIANWPEFPKPVEFGVEETVKFASKTRIAIAQIHYDGESFVGGTRFTTEQGQVLIARQMVTTNLGIQWTIVGSVVSPILVPYHGAPQIAAPEV